MPVALILLLAFLTAPLCPQKCWGGDCRMAEASSAPSDDCHSAARTESPAMKSSKSGMCEAPVIPARLENSAENLRKMFRVRADSPTEDTSNLGSLPRLFGEYGLRPRFAEESGRGFTETRSIFVIRI
jgi:hypothetical protein